MNTRETKTTRVNISLCFPELEEKSRNQLILSSLCASGSTLFELAAIWNWDGSKLGKLCLRFEGEEHLATHLGHSAVIAILPHWGNWEYIAYLFGINYNTTILYDDRRLDAFDDYVTRVRCRFGVRMVPATRSGLRQLLQAIDANELVCVLPDQVPTRGSSVIAPFMGVDAQTTTLVQSLVQRHKNPVVSITVERVPGGFHIRAQPVDDNVGSSDDLVAMTALNRAIARSIERDPAQYQWEYKRFRRTPGKDVYR